jgi:gamma-glutamylcyclotransferase (GGCT)/AIG2-like uncharacterized protein YtfP
MKKGDLLFVYGTLRQGEANDLSIKSGAELVGDDSINGRLYDLGWYPGVKLLKNNGFDHRLPSVTGTVFLLTDDNIVRHLDSYEGYPNLYDRSVVKTAEGREAWVYTYNDEVGDNQCIRTGDWTRQATRV